MTKFICISGKAQHGKDTSAGIFQRILDREYGKLTIIVHYADLLKYICTNYFGWDGNKDEAGRTLLQYIGTECIRKQDPNFWVNFVTTVIKFFDNTWDYVIIPDCRFPNELTGVVDAGFEMVHVRVNRPDYVSPLTTQQQNHRSEVALDNTKYDYLLVNTTIAKLEDQIKTVCEELEHDIAFEQLSILDKGVL